MKGMHVSGQKGDVMDSLHGQRFIGQIYQLLFPQDV